VEHLGTGGFASTFKVISADGADTYALKFVDGNLSEPERVTRELHALRRVDHANVVSYRDTGTVMFESAEYRAGSPWTSSRATRSLRLLNDGRTFSLAEAVSLLRQVVSGAAALGAAETAHRALSKNNLLITPTGRLVIVDLGMARHLDDETVTNLPTPRTPGWMSPEQVGPPPPTVTGARTSSSWG
jgi:serine/threonine protein kinase